MAKTLELRRQIAVFTVLHEDQIDCFFGQAREVQLKAGVVYAGQGAPADAMYVLLEGEFQWRGEFSGETFIRDLKAGEVTGILPFSRMKTYMLSGRAVSDGRVLRFPASLFPQLVQKMPELATRLVGLM